MSEKLIKSLRKLHTETTKLHAKGVEALHAAREEIFQCGDVRTLADTLSVLRDSQELVEDLRKQLHKVADGTKKLACLVWVKDSANNGDPIRTAHCTVSPRVKTSTPIPTKSKEPEVYAAFMTFLGITPLALEHEAARPHWPGVVDLVTSLVENGKELPPGISIDRLRTDFVCALRRKTEVETLLENWSFDNVEKPEESGPDGTDPF